MHDAGRRPLQRARRHHLPVGWLALVALLLLGFCSRFVLGQPNSSGHAARDVTAPRQAIEPSRAQPDRSPTPALPPSPVSHHPPAEATEQTVAVSAELAAAPPTGVASVVTPAASEPRDTITATTPGPTLPGVPLPSIPVERPVATVVPAVVEMLDDLGNGAASQTGVDASANGRSIAAAVVQPMRP